MYETRSGLVCGYHHVSRAAYDTSAPNAKRKYPNTDEGEADEEDVEEYKVREK